MKPFSELLDRLLYAPARTSKLALLEDYFRSVPDPDRGFGLAAIAGTLSLRVAKSGVIRELVAERTDPELFHWSYDFVGDLAETAALMWPEQQAGRDWPHLSEVVVAMDELPRGQLTRQIASWLDTLDATGRWALLKLATGSLRVGASAGLARAALARYGGVEPALVEEAWYATAPPYLDLFAWLDGRMPRPEIAHVPVFRPLMLAHPLDDEQASKLDLAEYSAEWKWDGIRVQVVAVRGHVRLYSRTGDDVGPAFPEVVERVRFEGVLDGELLVAREGEVASFNDLQQRLNRKAVTPAMLQDYPALVRLYDILFDGEEDLRGLPFLERRERLEAFVARERPEGMDLSPLIPDTGLDELDRMRRSAREGGTVEGLMLKRKDSLYVPGRPKGLWWKWKRDAHLVDCVLMYAQRGHGKRSSYYSDYTFGAWQDGPDGEELVPVGKAYAGYTDEELKLLDRWIRDHTIERFGPVRAVEPRLVFEVAFDSIHPSSRHKSGVAMRFPRIARIRWDKPAAEADRLATLVDLMG
ncbi:cisplatin damage response ATP-dependent DNA ligase [Geminicoccus flavidas]|uniref:cisplatin damage response ATP-dependent DNA ligase n=1 Tax=Geminicoccus flavidas TaxID=2506407 RepID=UPI0013591CCA|nr:cisplatin damage response ATP-dependent DNA ligase [Geminicoccus flavidas]